MLLGIVFCVCLVAANFLEAKVIRLGPLAVTAGMLVFPLSYIINDNFLVVGLGQIAVMLPAAPFWEGEESFNFVFGLAPRIAAASLVAFLAGSFLNAYVMSKMKLKSKGRHFSLRAVVSTLAGESADSLIFFPIAFAGMMPAMELLKMMAVQAVLKTVYEIMVLPVTVRVVRYIKRVDGSDAYDNDISYNILKINEL